MRKKRFMAAVAGAVMLMTVAAPGPAAQARSDQPALRQLTGELGGSGELEGGCAWLDRPDARYEVWWPEGYRIEFSPLRLIDPAGKVIATEGDLVTVRGRHMPEVATVCQVGPVFDAQSVAK